MRLSAMWWTTMGPIFVGTERSDGPSVWSAGIRRLEGRGARVILISLGRVGVLVGWMSRC